MLVHSAQRYSKHTTPRTFEQASHDSIYIEEASLSIHQLEGLLKCHPPFPIRSLSTVLGEHIFEHLRSESSFGVIGIAIASVLSAVNIFDTDPKQRVGNPTTTSDVGETRMYDEHREEGYENIEPELAKPNIRLQGSDKAIFVDIEEINMLL